MDEITLYAVVALPDVYSLDATSASADIKGWYSHEHSATTEAERLKTWKSAVVIPQKLTAGAIAGILNRAAGLDK